MNRFEKLKKIMAKCPQNTLYTASEIIEQFRFSYPEYKSDIVHSDYCYNTINIDPVSQGDNNIFILVDDGSYKHVGENYPYNGDVYHKGEKFCKCKNGKLVRPLPNFK